MSELYLGYRESDRASVPWAKFYNPQIDAFQPQVTDAFFAGGMAQELFPPVTEAARLQEDGYWPVETGYARMPGGAISVFCLTLMPRVEPAMWDWWFGWHGDDPTKYKLWHPKAHVHVGWEDGQKGIHGYVGRISRIVEYIGSERINGAIGFVAPSFLGFDEELLAGRGEVVICARIGVPGTPLKGGWLVHQLRPVEGGSEMRSRMWMGGANAAIGDEPGGLGKGLMRILSPLVKRMLPDPAELLAHNAQEMAHLAGFLPELYAEFGPSTASTGTADAS